MIPDNALSAPVESSMLHDPRSVVRDYIAMTKPGVNRMVVLTTFIGSLLAFGPGRLSEALGSSGLLLATVFGTWLLAASSAVLNMVMERDRDRRMERTANRPIAAGRVSPVQATLFGVILALLGTLTLSLWVNPLTTLLGVLTLVIYLFIYTPLKGRTPWATYVGAVPGALPTVMGWTAVAGASSFSVLDIEAAAVRLFSLDTGLLAWVLFGILFFWQLPHFFAIGWMHRIDYARGGHEMLAVRDTTGRRSGIEAVLNAVLLLAVGLVPFFAGMNGPIYALFAGAVGGLFVVAALRFALEPSRAQARLLLLASLIYLPLSLLLLFLDR